MKVLVTSCVIAGILLTIGFPLVMGNMPSEEASRQARADYAVMLLIYLAVTVAIWFTAAFGALALMKRARKEFLEENSENLRELVEGSLRDHDRSS